MFTVYVASATSRPIVYECHATHPGQNTQRDALEVCRANATRCKSTVTAVPRIKSAALHACCKIDPYLITMTTVLDCDEESCDGNADLKSNGIKRGRPQGNVVVIFTLTSMCNCLHLTLSKGRPSHARERKDLTLAGQARKRTHRLTWNQA